MSLFYKLNLFRLYDPFDYPLLVFQGSLVPTATLESIQEQEQYLAPPIYNSWGPNVARILRVFLTESSG